jgi:hypothetical protein
VSVRDYQVVERLDGEPSPYVTSPATSPPEDCSASKSARMPPGFINAMTALIGRPV